MSQQGYILYKSLVPIMNLGKFLNYIPPWANTPDLTINWTTIQNVCCETPIVNLYSFIYHFMNTNVYVPGEGIIKVLRGTIRMDIEFK